VVVRTRVRGGRARERLASSGPLKKRKTLPGSSLINF